MAKKKSTQDFKISVDFWQKKKTPPPSFCINTSYFFYTIPKYFKYNIY